MNQKPYQPSKSSIQKPNKPIDLVSLNSLKSDPEYKHIRMNHERIYNLEKRGLITIHKNEKGHNFVSLSDIKEILNREKEELETTVTVNTLESDPQYKHLKLYWEKTLELIELDELKQVEVLSGAKAISIKSLNNYIQKIEAEKAELNGYIPLNKVISSKNSKYKIVTKDFINVFKEQLKFKCKNSITYILVSSLEKFIEHFQKEWISVRNAKKVPKFANYCTTSILTKIRKKNIVKMIYISQRSYIHIPSFERYVNELIVEEKIKKKQMEQEINRKQQVGRNFILLSEVSSFIKFKVNKDVLKYLGEQGNFTLKDFQGEILVNKQEVIKFFKNYCNIGSLSNNLKISSDQIIEVCKSMNIDIISSCNSDINYIHHDRFCEALKVYILNNYFTLKQAEATLKLNRSTFRRIREKELSEDSILNYKNIIYIQKNAINSLIQQQTEILNDWYTPLQAHKYITAPDLKYYVKKNKIKIKPTPDLVRAFSPTGKYLYYKDDVTQILNTKKKNEQLASLDINDPVNVFQVGYEQIYKLKFSSYVQKTEAIWNHYVKKRILEKKLDSSHMFSFIKQLIFASELIINATLSEKKEIYSFTSNDLNKYFFSPDEIPKDYKYILYDFIKQLHEQLITLAKEHGKKSFILKNVINPYLLPRNERVKEIYSFEEYLLLYDFANNISFHKEKTIKDIKNKFQGNRHSRYDSMWLYILINLNNPWNHGEIISIPKIDLVHTEIQDLDWIENNEISLRDAKTILRQLQLWDSRRMKTDIQQNFSISNELLMSFATAAVLCELRRRNEKFTSDKLINFETKDQKLRYTHKPYVEFFKSFSIPSFKFDNLKFSRTLISFKHTVLTELTEPENAGLLKYDRGHADFETTNIYIYIPQEHLNFLCNQIFTRDIMGNIFYTLSNIVYGETKNRVEQTENILALKERFNSISRIESIAGVLNQIDLERHAVQDIISDLDLTKATALYNKLIVNKMPAKEDNYQCLNYPFGCKFSGRNCSDCPLSIPNYLAIMKVTDKLYLDIYELNKKFESSSEHEKVVLSNNVNQSLRSFGSLISHLTEDEKNEVYHYISVVRSNFVTYLATLPDFHSYITYTEKLEVNS